jgi:hypothetical protein
VQSKYRLDWTGDGSKTAAMSAGTRYTLDCCNQTVTLNGTAYSSAVTKATDPLDYPVFLFNINNAGSVYGNGMRMRLYSAEIYLDGTTLSARYLPAVTNGVAGVYDPRGAAVHRSRWRYADSLAHDHRHHTGQQRRRY